MSEFALSGGRSSLCGQTLNPYKLNRYPSGSSGGVGAAIAANFGAIGMGSDTGGSIRGPATVNSLVGIKPTLGLTSRDGIIPVASSFDVGGPMARTVTDAAIALGSVAGIDPNDPQTLASQGKFFKDYTPFLNENALSGARLGVVRNFFGGNVEVDQSIKVAIAIMEELGAIVVDPLSFSDDFLAERDRISSTIINSEFKPQLEAYLATLARGYPKTLTEIIAMSESSKVVNSALSVSPRRIDAYKRAEASGGLTASAYINAVENGIPFVRTTILALMDSNNLDALIYPSVRCPPEPLPSVNDPVYACAGDPFEAMNLASITGFPDVNVPTGLTEDGLPIGVSFLGRAYSEPRLLGLAYAYERATLNRRPSPLVPPLLGEEVDYEHEQTV